MPAVEITRLRDQVNLIAEQFGAPRELVHSLRILFEFYADRTYQLRGVKLPMLKIPEYHLPPLVLRQLELALGAYCNANPLATLEVVDALWAEPMMEPRQLSAALLGKIPPSHFPQVVERLVRWSSSVDEAQIRIYLAEKGSERIRREAPNQWIEILNGWLQSGNSENEALALQSMISLIQDHQFENLPLVFDLLSPLLRKITPKQIPLLEREVEALAKRSPRETIYFLKQMAASSTDQTFFRLLRACQTYFPEDLRASLRDTIKQNQPEK